MARRRKLLAAPAPRPVTPPPVAVPAGFIPAMRLAEARALTAELARRRLEALRLYEPLPTQQAFHRSPTRMRLVRGGNRTGKTICSAVEVARALTGQDPFHKYPKRDGRCFAVGLKLDHVGQVMWRKLGRAGAFKIIRDRVTNAWRAFRPHDPDDAAREAEAKPAPPLIPPRLIKAIAWENKAKGIPKQVTLKNGWELNFYSSEGKPPNGVDIDLFWLDEEILDEEWYPELRARIVDRKGRGVWSATPQAGTEQLFQLYERAVEEESRNLPARSVEDFHLLLSDNTHIDEQEKRDLMDDVAMTDEQRRVRIEGEFAFTSFKVYPEFHRDLHTLEYFAVPADWCRYAIIDPGYQVCAVLFAAVPPPHVQPPFYPGEVYLYDELYLRDCNAATFAERMAQKAQGQSFQAFLIDYHGSIRSELGVGRTIFQQYSEALQAKGVKSAATGGSFLYASDDVDAGLLAVHDWLRVRDTGRPKLFVFRTLENWLREVKYYRKRRVGSEILDKPLQRNCHLMDCFDAETEVLSSEGWKRFAELTGEESLATVNLETDLIEYQVPTELIMRPYSGDMIAFGGHKLDALVTPTHRMVVYPREGMAGYDEGRPVIREAQDLSIRDRLKLHARWEGAVPQAVLIDKAGLSAEKQVDPFDLAEFFGWYVSEGCAAKTVRMPGHGYAVLVCQNYGAKRQRLEALLQRLPWHWNQNSGGFYTSCKQLWEMVAPLGGVYSKRVPQWIKDACPAIIERFLEGAVLGDGWVQNGRRTYATVSKHLADDIQELFIKTGRSASIIPRTPKGYRIKGRTGTNTVPQYWVSEWTNPHGGLRDKDGNPNFSEQPYEGVVYCASVPNGTLIVRRNGKPLVAGNCTRYLAMYNPTWVKPQSGKARLTGALAAFRDLLKRSRHLHGDQGSYVRLGPVGNTR